MTEVHFYDFVTNAPHPGIDTMEFPETPIAGDEIELPDYGIYLVRDRKWVVSNNGEVCCRLLVVKQ